VRRFRDWRYTNQDALASPRANAKQSPKTTISAACLRKLHLSEHPKSASGTLNARTGCLWDVQGREVLDR